MVKVTDKDYYLDGFTQQIGDSICARVVDRKQDILIIFDGAEGSGKTNASVALAYYISWVTKRPFTHENVFFDLETMIKYAGTTEKQIILWDEAALGGLSADWTLSSQKRLKAMLMVCRKKRHVFIFNVPRFYRLSPDIIERSLCLFHIYENDKEQPGNFMFISRDYLQTLYQTWRSTKYANYWKYKKLHGCFTYVLPQLINEDAYEAMKDGAIAKLANSGDDDKKIREERHYNKRMREIYHNLKGEGFNEEKTAKLMDLSRRFLEDLRKGWEAGAELDKT